MNFLKLPAKNRFTFILGFMSGLFLIGCGSQSFQYRVAEPIRLEPIDLEEASGPTFFGEGSGFIWTDCGTANDKAIGDLLSHAKSKGFESVADL